ncbi:Chorismate mutase 1-like protein, partial [Lunasporangiospora selenospora]
QKTYIQLIQAGDRDGIMNLLTNKTVEDALLRRLRQKAQIYGRDITETGAAVITNPGNGKGQKISPDVVVDMYEQFVIPLTKEVEVDYLMKRLDGWQIPQDS